MTPRLHRRFLAPVVAATLLLVAASCGSDDKDSSSTAAPTTAAAGAATTPPPAGSAAAPTGDLTKLKLTLQWVVQAQFAGYLAAKELGYYEDEGLDVEIQPGGPDINPLQLLLSGDTDIALQDMGNLLSARDQGADIVSIGQTFERGAYRQIYFADNGITTAPDDFKGKSIGLWSGFSPQMSATFGKMGLDINKDATVFNQAFDMVAFLDGQIDSASAMTYNEYAQALAGNTEGKTIEVFDPNTYGTATLEDTVNTTQKWLDENPDATVGFMRASAKGWMYCRDNPDACVDIVLKNGTALPKNFQQWQMNEVNKLIWPSTNGIYELTPEMFQTTADILKNYGVIKNAATTDAFDMTFRDKAVEGMSDADLKGTDFQPQQLDPKVLFGNN